MKKVVDLTIIIVNWNSWEYVNKCIRSIYANQESLKVEIIIIDNNSQDKSVENIRKNYPDVKLVSLYNNIGFPKANNIGFRLAKGKYILALNPDTEVMKDTFKGCIEYLNKNPEYGCVGVKVSLPTGKTQYHCARRFPTLMSLIMNYLFLDKIFPNVEFIPSIDITSWDHETSRDVDMISGAFMLFRKEVYERIGGFDDRIPMYLEDQEYCLRMIKNNYKIRYVPDFKIVHYTGKSSKKAPKFWIEELKYEANYLFLKDYKGYSNGVMYIISILYLFPFRIMILPLIRIGSIIKDNNNTFLHLLSNSIASFLWSLKRIRSLIY